MGFKSTVRLALASFCVSLFAACSGGSIGSNQDPGDGSGGGDGGGGGAVGSPALLTLTPQQEEITADGISTVLLIATLADAAGRPISGETIAFEANAGELRNVANDAALTESVTGANGQAALRLRSGTTTTRATLVARHASGLASQTNVDFVPGPLARLEGPTLSPVSVPPGGTTTVVVRTFDANNNAVPGELVAFDLSQDQTGGAFSAVAATSDANGLVSVTYQAGPQSGTDVLRARAGAGTAPNTLRTADLAVVAGAAQISALNLQTGSPSIVASGTSMMALRAEVLDQNGDPVPGVSVSFSSTAGTLSANTATTNTLGTAQVQLTSSTIAQQVTVAASTGGFNQAATVQFVPGPPSSIAVQASPSTLAPSTEASLLATVLDANGNPVPSVAVQFSNQSPSLGSVPTASENTNAVGQASAIYQAGSDVGTDTVFAALPDFGAVPRAAATVTIDSVATTVTALDVIAGSEGVSPGGTVLIRATVTTSSGTVAGLEVSFATTAVGASLSSPTALTNSRGEAEVLLTAPDDPGRVTVTASTAGFNADVSVDVGVGVPALVDLFVFDAPTLPYNFQTPVRVTVRDANGSPVADADILLDTPVNQSEGVIETVTGRTDANGRFTTSYTTGPGGSAVVQDRLSARVANSGLAAVTSDLNVSPRLGGIELETTSEPLTANGMSQTIVRATVLDADGNPVRNAVVTFNATAGTLTPAAPSQLTTNPQGQAEVMLTAPITAGEAVVIVDVTGGLSATTVVDFASAGPATLNAFAFPENIGVGGTSTLIARIRDSNGNPVAGTDVQFRLPAGSRATISSVTATTNADGEATTTYLTRDATGTEAVEVLTASGGLMDSVSVTTSSEALVVGEVSLTLGTASVPAGGDDVAVRAQVLSTTGVPIEGATVQFTTTAGVLSAASAMTDQSGIAQVLLTPPDALGAVELAVTSGGFRDEATLEVVAGAADAVNSIIAAQPSAIIADGMAISTLTVVLNDRLGNPLPDGTVVTLATDAGQLITNQGELANGRASFELQAANRTALANVRVIGVSGLETTVQFEAASSGEPASIRFSSVDPRISVVGVGQQDQTQIRVTVLDSAGNPIDESLYADPALNNLRAQFVSRPQGGESIAGTNADGDIVTSGTDSFVDLRTRGGLATVTLRSGIRSGVVEVRFSVLNPGGSDFTLAADVAAIAALPQVSIAGGPPHTLVFTQPVTNAIENLANGNYRRQGKVDVTDRYGNSVPDGTVVNLQLMDSVILHDSTAVTAADADTLNRSGNSLIRRRCTTEPLANGEADGCGVRGALASASSFSTSITRNDVPRFLEENDLVLIRNTPSADKLRVVTTVDNATQLTVHQPYRFDLANGEVWTGASLSGAQIAGFSLPDADGNRTLLIGTGVVMDGIAEFRVTYPANVGSILSGCYGYPYADRSYDDRDRRSSVPQSRQVIVAASAGDTVAGIDVGNFCFAAIVAGSITPQVSEVAIGRGASVDVGLTVRDGGDQIRLPYVPVACFLSEFNTNDDDTNPATVFALDVDVLANDDGFEETDVNGVAVLRLSNVGDDSGDAVVTCTNGDATTTINVTGL